MIYQQLQRSLSNWVLWVLSLGLVTFAHAQTYTVFDLGVPPVSSPNGVNGYQINANGEVAGSLLGAGQPLVVTNGNRVALAALHLNTSGQATAINAAGVVAGQSCSGYYQTCQSVKWTDGVPSELASGIDFLPYGINSAGDVVGVAVNLIGRIPFVADVFRDGKLSALPQGAFQPPNGGEALGINSSGVIVGYLFDPTRGDGTTIAHAVVWTGSTVQDLRTNAAATGINDLGQVVGYAQTSDGYRFHAATWIDGKFTDLGAPKDYLSAAAAINESGMIVGYGVSSTYDESHAMVWADGVMSDLNELIDPKIAKTILLSQAVSINDSGQILANGYDTATNVSHTYVLSPSGAAKVAEPTFSVIPQTYATTQTVALADTTPGATIHYTLDGTLPTSRSAKYTAALTVDRTTTIRASAYLENYLPSTAASGSFQIIPGTGFVAVPLTSVANVLAISSAGVAVTHGLDGLGDTYATDLLGEALVWSGAQFNFSPGSKFNGVSNTEVPLPAGTFTAIKLLATGARGNRAHETFVVTYLDGSTSHIAQGISDWYTPQNYPGEDTAVTMDYRMGKLGVTAYGPYHLYGYALPLDNTKEVKSLTLPASKYVVVLAVTMSGESASTEPALGRSPIFSPHPIQR